MAVTVPLAVATVIGNAAATVAVGWVKKRSCAQAKIRSASALPMASPQLLTTNCNRNERIYLICLAIAEKERRFLSCFRKLQRIHAFSLHPWMAQRMKTRRRCATTMTSSPKTRTVQVWRNCSRTNKDANVVITSPRERCCRPSLPPLSGPCYTGAYSSESKASQDLLWPKASLPQAAAAPVATAWGGSSNEDRSSFLQGGPQRAPFYI
jgi:hypothetical protein